MLEAVFSVATAGVDTADLEELVRTLIKCIVCELAVALELIVVTSFKSPLNPITNPHPMSSHLTRDSTLKPQHIVSDHLSFCNEFSFASDTTPFQFCITKKTIFSHCLNRCFSTLFFT
jgi:hypothetical protein